MAKPLLGKQLNPPIVEMLTGNEVEEAIVRFVLVKNGIDPDAQSKASSKVSFRNVRLPDQSLAMFAAVAVMPAAPADALRKASDTPVPSEKTDG